MAAKASLAVAPARVLEMPRVDLLTKPSSSSVVPERRLTWASRLQDLDTIKRYGPMKVMYYRTTDAFHVGRVKTLVQRPEIFDLARELVRGLDGAMVPVLADHHDDPENYPDLGDVTLQAKLMMNAEQLSDHQKKEILAAEEVARCYAPRRGPRRVQGYLLLDLYHRAILKDSKEAQLVSLVDKMDGFCEALHELLAGNTPFAEAVMNYFVKTFALDRLIRKYPLIQDIFFDPRNPFVSPTDDSRGVVQLSDLFRGKTCNARPHTPETVACNTHIPMYELWKRVTIEHFGIGALIDQKESY